MALASSISTVPPPLNNITNIYSTSELLTSYGKKVYYQCFSKVHAVKWNATIQSELCSRVPFIKDFMASTTLKAPFYDSACCITKSQMSGVLNFGLTVNPGNFPDIQVGSYSAYARKSSSIGGFSAWTKVVYLWQACMK